MRETAKFLGAGVGNIINILNPEMVVISGGVTRAGDHLFHATARGSATPAVQGGT